MSRTLSLLIIIFFTTVACTNSGDNVVVFSDRPSDREFDSGEFLEYRVASTDSSCFYDIDVYARIHHSSKADKIPLIIRIISPAGKIYADTLRLNANNNSAYPSYARSGVWRDYKWSYRNRVTLPENGTWYFRVDLIEGSNPVSGLTELGFIFSKR